MNSGGTAVMQGAIPNKIRSRLHPRSNLRRVAHPWVVELQEGQIHAVLEGELDVGVVKLQARLLTACNRDSRVAVLVSTRLEPQPLTKGTASCGPMGVVVVIEVHVIWISGTS